MSQNDRLLNHLQTKGSINQMEAWVDKELIETRLLYEEETGLFFWKDNFSSRARKGSKAGAVNKEGYVIIGICGNSLYAHRLAWICKHGNFNGFIDHINQDKSDNRIANLRICDNSSNLQNRGKQANNTSGYKGVVLNKATKKWDVQIWAFHKKISKNGFNSKESAYEKYIELSLKHHGDFSFANRLEK